MKQNKEFDNMESKNMEKHNVSFSLLNPFWQKDKTRKHIISERELYENINMINEVY